MVREMKGVPLDEALALIDRLTCDLARATGQTEAAVRTAHGMTTEETS